MGLFDVLRYGLKDPTVPDKDDLNAFDKEELKAYDVSSNNVAFFTKKKTPFMDAVMKNDVNRLRYYGKHFASKLTAEALSDALPFAQSVEAFDILISLGAITSPQSVLSAAKNIMKNLKPNKTKTDTLKFFKANDIPMSFNDGKPNPKSLYDCAADKTAWFEMASQGAINHELRQAVASGDYYKAEEFIAHAKKCGKKIDMEAKKEGSLTAMERALNIKDDVLRQKMVSLLHKNGAKIKPQNNPPEFKTELKESSYRLQTNDARIISLKERQAALAKVKESMPKETRSTAKTIDVDVKPEKRELSEADVIGLIKKADLKLLNVIARTGHNFDNPKYWEAAEKKDVMEFIISNRKEYITENEVKEAEQADKDDEYGYFNDPNQTTHNKFKVLQKAYANQQKSRMAKTSAALKAARE